jgi:hypothetical protein
MNECCEEGDHLGPLLKWLGTPCVGCGERFNLYFGLPIGFQVGALPAECVSDAVGDWRKAMPTFLLQCPACS